MERTNQGVAVGDAAPDFTLADAASGDEYRLRQWAGQDVLLVFFRGTWCPFCREQMRLLAREHELLAARGVQVVGVICQRATSVRTWVEANPLPFPLLADERRTVARAYGVHYWLSWDGVNLARPALFILDREQKITFRYVGANMRDLPLTTVLERFLGYLRGDGPVSAGT